MATITYKRNLNSNLNSNENYLLPDPTSQNVIYGYADILYMQVVESTSAVNWSFKLSPPPNKYFIGWNTQADGNGATILSSNYSGNDKTIYAMWEDWETLTINDLTNTCWCFINDYPRFTHGYYEINFTSNNQNFNCLQADVEAGAGGGCTGAYYSSDGPYGSNMIMVYGDTRYDNPIGWQDQAYRIIKITGGQDATNSELINILKTYATLLPTLNPITDLTGTTWELYSYPIEKLYPKVFNINFNSNNNSYSSFYNSYNSDSLGAIGLGEVTLHYDNTEVCTNEPEGWNGNYNIITITGGNDATNLDLITFLYTNATLIPSFEYTLCRNHSSSDSTTVTHSGFLPSIATLNWTAPAGKRFKEWVSSGNVHYSVGDNPTEETPTTLISAVWEDIIYYSASDEEFKLIADAIRAKGGTSASLVYPTGFVSAIEAIETGASYPEAAGNYFGTNLISFTVQYPNGNKNYFAIPGMIWSDFVNSEYNYDNFTIPYDAVQISDNEYLLYHYTVISKDELIVSDRIYNVGGHGSIN